MENPQNNNDDTPPIDRDKSVKIVAGVAALLVAAGAGATLWTLNSRDLKQPIVSPSPTVTPTAIPTSPVVEQTVEIYGVQDNNGQLQLVAQPLQVPASNDPTQVLTAAFDQLLNRFPAQNAVSEVPKGTKLLKLTTENDNVYVNLSPEFTQGGGSASMTGRLGQVIYTATTLNPNAKVFLSVGGQPLKVLGGEGLEVPQPVTRQIFEKEFPF